MLDTAREGTDKPVDKRDETVRGSIPLFKLRSRAEREKVAETGNIQKWEYNI